MAQVYNPEIKKDNSVDNIVGGLQIFSAIQDMRVKNAEKKQSMTSATSFAQDEAMKRRLSSIGANPSFNPIIRERME